MSSFKYSLRFALLPGIDVDIRIEKLLDFCKAAQIDDVMFFINAEDMQLGHISIEQSKPYIEVIKKAAKRLKEAGITLSLNPWMTLGHRDAGRKLLPEQRDFGLMVDQDGLSAQIVACPLSEAWINYYTELTEYYALQLKPHIMWIEDDLRLLHHGPLNLGGCFCPQHMEKYGEYLGTKLTREQFVSGMISGNQSYRKAYSEVNGAAVQKIIDALTARLKGKQKKYGLMTSSAATYIFEGRDQHKIFNTLAQDAPAVDRVSLSAYRQDNPQNYCNTVNTSCIVQRTFIPEETEVYGEIENFPMTRYCKSVNFTAFQIEITMPFLMSGTTLDIFEFNGNGVTDGDKFADMLAKLKPFLQRVKDLDIKYSSLSGVNVLLSQESHITVKGETLADLRPKDTWWGGYLAASGIGFKYTLDRNIKNDIVAFSGQVLRSLSKREIIGLFKNNTVLLTAKSAQVLCELDLAYLADIKNITPLKERTGTYSYEQSASAGLYGYEDMRASVQYFCGAYSKIEYGERSKKIYTKMYNYDSSYVGEGIACIDNKVLILPFDENFFPQGLYHPLRKSALQRIIASGCGGAKTVFADGCMCSPYLYSKGETDYLMLCNYLDDGEDKISFYINKNYVTARVMTAQNPVFMQVPLTKNGFNYTLQHPLNPSGTVLIELK